MISLKFRRLLFNINRIQPQIQNQRIYQDNNNPIVIIISRRNITNNNTHRQNYQNYQNNNFKPQISTEDLDALLPHEHPPSISYFTARPTYNDLFINLDDLISKYKKYPKKRQQQTQQIFEAKVEEDLDKLNANNNDDSNNAINANDVNDVKDVNNNVDTVNVNNNKNESGTLWKLKNQLEVDLGLNLKSNQYKQIIRKLNQLAQINPELTPRLQDFLVIFKRKDLEKAKKELQANKTLDQFGRAYAVGRRKQSVAHVWVVRGQGHVLVNGIPLANYFRLLKDKEYVLKPFQVTNLLGKFNVWIRVKGGGNTGQAGAIVNGLSKCLLIHDINLKPILRKAKLITRDFRKVERKKPGLAKARKSYTWVKR